MTNQSTFDHNAFNIAGFDDFGFPAEMSDELRAADEASTIGGAAVALVDADPSGLDYLARQFETRVDTASSLVEIETRLGSAPLVVVVGPSRSTESDLAIIQRWSKFHPNVGTVLVVPELSTGVMRNAMRVGVRDVLAAPLGGTQLRDAVTKVGDDLKVAYEGVISPGEYSGEESDKGKVIGVFSTKGGSGKSVTATNMAIVLAQNSDRPVVLIDGHLQFGDVAIMLNVKTKHTVIDALSHIDANDPEVLRLLMAVHEPSGLLVLPAPAEPMFADQVTGDQMSRLIEIVRGFAGHIVVDLPAIFNETVLAIIEQSDDIVLVAGLDIPNIKNVKIGLSTLSLLDVPQEKLHLVMNRSDSKVKLDVNEVERLLKMTAIAYVPSDVVVPISVNTGDPVVLSSPRSGVARAFEQLALRFLDRGPQAEPTQQPSRRKFFG